jgi:transposase InsO family protein
VAEAEAMSETLSSSAGKPYGLARVCRWWEIARSTVYAARERRQRILPPQKRGPKTSFTDEELLDRIRHVLANAEWVGEGHRKAWAQLRAEEVRTSKPRVLRLMREANLLAPARQGAPRGPRAHDGKIITDRPDEMWGTDGTTTMTGEGQATVFIVTDHFTGECLGLHGCKPGTRFEALEPVKQAVTEVFGGGDEGIAGGVLLRHDNGSVYTSEDFQREIRFLGLESSPSFVRAPEGNGCAERFIRTLKEQLLWLRFFSTVAELSQALAEFRVRYNHRWRLERHGYRSPADVRASFIALEKAA